MPQPQGNPPDASIPPSKKASPLVWILVGCIVIVAVGGIVVSGLMWWGYHRAKSYVKQAVEKNTGEMKSVALWADVPPMEGMTQSQQAEMPLALRAITRPFLDTMMKGLNDGKDAGRWDVAYYILKGNTTRDLESFYTAKRMADQGWQQQGGCANLSEALFCTFQKQEGDKTAGLLIVAADDRENKSTAIYFIRQDARQ